MTYGVAVEVASVIEAKGEMADQEPMMLDQSTTHSAEDGVDVKVPQSE